MVPSRTADNHAHAVDLRRRPRRLRRSARRRKPISPDADTLLRNLETLQINVATAYYAVLQDNATVTADDQLVREFEMNEDSVTAQIRNGAAARSDLPARSFRRRRRAAISSRRKASRSARRQTFATTLGLDADTAILPQQIGEETAGANPTYQASLTKALVLRPDYLAARTHGRFVEGQRALCKARAFSRR